MLAEYVRLRAPQNHGQTLQSPPLSDGSSVVKRNQKVLAQYWGALESIRDIARAELSEMAYQYSRQYSNVSETGNVSSIVMAGHQPTLFHPGVWFKNFALDALGKAANATAINLVVDNDLCGDTNVLCPQYVSGTAQVIRVPYDSAAVAVPHEMRPTIDRATFLSFGQRLATSIGSTVDAPLIDSLWPEVTSASGDLGLSASIAAGRHRLEQKHGIGNLELPVSHLSASKSFAMFVDLIATEPLRFLEIYNQSLDEYRNTHRIRSRSHPVPELESDGRWHEIPFWVWGKASPQRRRVFASCRDDKVELSDRDQWTVSLKRNCFVSSFVELNQPGSGMFIRPRALATTMFSRLFASDLFIHGIGGAKYDQLGDVIMKRFFEVEPPKFMTMTATMKLPLEFENVTRQTVTELEVQMRKLRYRPECQSTCEELKGRKSYLIENPPESGSRKLWHDEIAAINDQLFESLSEKRIKLEKEIARAKAALPESKILGSREYSFALFSGALVEQLRKLSVTF